MANANPLSFIFDGSDPNVNAQLRQRIALAMMAKPRRYPKTLGEGLAAIGDSLGDIGMARRLEATDRAQLEAARNGAPPVAPSVPQPAAYAPTGDIEPEGDPAAPTALGAPPPAAEDLLTTAPSQPASVLGEAAPAGLGGTTPASLSPQQSASLMNPNPTRTAIAARLAGSGVSDGGYNLIDAQAGMKRQGPGRVQDAVMAAFPGQPDMQAYASQLSAGEQSRPGEVSPTGARGPWQFVPGTARQYGLTNPDDPMASAEALKAFTADNVATFTATNGRPPTMAEMAVMHQQGGQTGANMVAGTGNASPRNLALNNVPPGASPADAVSRIKGYYGLPDRIPDLNGAPAANGDARSRIAEAVAPSPPPPVMAFDGEPSDAASFANPGAQIRQAPPAQAPIRQAPPPQSAPPGPGYVMTAPREPVAPQPVPMTPREAALRKAITDNPNNEYFTKLYGPEVQRLAAAREFEQNRRIEKYKDDMTLHRNMLLEREKQRQAAPEDLRKDEKHRTEERKARDEESVRAQFANMDPNKVFAHLEESKKTADSARQGLVGADAARRAIEGGAITGLGADLRLNVAKLVTGIGLKDMGNEVANTESFRAYMAPLVASALKATVGSTQVSDADRRFAENAAAGRIALDAASIKRVIDFVGRASRLTLDEHEKKVNAFFGQSPQGRALFGVEIPAVEKRDPLLSKEERQQNQAAEEWLKANPNDPRAPAVRKKLTGS